MRQRPLTKTRFLTENGRVTEKLRSDLSDVLNAYVPAVKFWQPKTRKPLESYTIREAYVVGSVLQGNDESDLDILLIGNHFDGEDYRFFKIVMAEQFYSNRSKRLAIDVYIRDSDEFPEKPSFEITEQVQDMLDKHNKEITSPKNSKKE